MLGGSSGVGKLCGAKPHTTSPHHHCHRASRVGVGTPTPLLWTATLMQPYLIWIGGGCLLTYLPSMLTNTPISFLLFALEAAGLLWASTTYSTWLPDKPWVRDMVPMTQFNCVTHRVSGWRGALFSGSDVHFRCEGLKIDRVR
eukprot:gene19027-biopygen5801